MRYESYSKPEKCPSCGSTRIADIMYGLPVFSKELEDDLTSGKIALGGYCVTSGDPRWKCTDCDESIYQLQNLEAIKQ